MKKSSQTNKRSGGQESSPVRDDYERLLPKRPHPFADKSVEDALRDEPAIGLYMGVAAGVASSEEKQEWEAWKAKHPEAQSKVEAIQEHNQKAPAFDEELQLLLKKGRSALSEYEPLPDTFFQSSTPDVVSGEESKQETEERSGFFDGIFSFRLQNLWGGVLAVAALALVVVWMKPPSTTPTLIEKGFPLSIEMFVRRSGKSISVDKHWVVQDGDEVRFRYQLGREKAQHVTGYLSLFLVTHRGDVTQIWPEKKHKPIQSGIAHLLAGGWVLSPPKTVERIFGCGDKKAPSLSSIRLFLQQQLKRKKLQNIRSLSQRFCSASRSWLLQKKP